MSPLPGTLAPRCLHPGAEWAGAGGPAGLCRGSLSLSLALRIRLPSSTEADRRRDATRCAASFGGRGFPRPPGGNGEGGPVSHGGLTNDRRVFDKFAGQNSTFEQAKDAYDACSIMDDGSARDECYVSFGCDGSRVERYLDTVSDLESKLPAGPNIPGLLMNLATNMVMAFGLACLMLLQIGWSVVRSMVMGVWAVADVMCGLLRLRWRSEHDFEHHEKLYTFDAVRKEFREIHGSKSENGASLPNSP